MPVIYACGECGECFDRAGYCARDGKPLAATDDPVIGTEIGRYRVARLLAEGGMGRVYLGVQPAIGSRVAIKLLADSTSADLLDRFFAEARAVNLIRHENIVSVLDMAKLADGRPYILMEYIEGQTLGSLVRAGGAPLGGVVQVMMEVLSALGAAHQIGIVHRDLKPDNVLVTSEGHSKVLDFGIAKLMPGLSQQLSPRTRTGALLGTPAYMAPEQISGTGNIDPRTDIYAAGVVFFEAVTGRVPFVAETLFDLMRMHLETPPPSPRALRPDLPAPLEGVILTALAKDPAQRFQTANAMAHALQHAARELRPEDWRSLSTRGALITGGGTQLARGKPPTTHAAPTPRHDGAAERTRAQSGTRGSLPWILGMIATAVIAVLVTLLVVRRGEEGAVAAAPARDAATEVASDMASTSPSAPSSPGSAAPRSPAAPGSPAAPASPAAPGSPVAPAPTSSGSAASRSPSGSGAPRTPPGPTTSSKDGVTLDNVTIVQTAGTTKEIEQPADYDPKQVDALAYLPKATALAHRLYPDAKLTRFDFEPVRSNGLADLTMKDADATYVFRSPLHSKRPAGVPPNVPVERPCMIYVELAPKRVTARVVEDDACNDKLVRVPRCKPADVWKRARAAGVPADHVAKVSWLFDEKWFFDSDLGNDGSGETTSFVDSCP